MTGVIERFTYKSNAAAGRNKPIHKLGCKKMIPGDIEAVPSIKDLCLLLKTLCAHETSKWWPLLQKVCAVGQALCNAPKKIEPEEVAATPPTMPFMGALVLSFLMALFLMCFFGMVSTAFWPSKDSQKGRRKWKAVVRDNKKRSQSDNRYFAKDFFENGDVEHGVLLLRYLKKRGFVIPHGDVTLTLDKLTIHRIPTHNAELEAHFNADCPNPDMTWKYALGCLQNVTKVKHVKLWKLINAMSASDQQLSSETSDHSDHGLTKKDLKKWKDVTTDIRARTTNSYLAEKFFTDGDVPHGILILRYIKARGDRFVASPEMLSQVNLKDSGRVTIDKAPKVDMCRKLRDTMCGCSQGTPPSDSDAWTYAMGCLRNCGVKSLEKGRQDNLDLTLHKLLTKITDSARDRQSKAESSKEKKKELWQKVVKDIRKRSGNAFFAERFFGDGDLRHGILILRYIQTFEHLNLPTAKSQVQLNNMTVHINADSIESPLDALSKCDDRNDVPSPKVAWDYALGCLRNCKQCSNSELYNLLSDILGKLVDTP